MKQLINFKSYLTRLRGLTVILLLMLTCGNAWSSTTTLFEETWGSYTGAVGSYTFSGTTVSGSDDDLAYSVDNNNDAVQNTPAGSITSNNLFFYKNAASSYTISGIDLQGAKNLTLTFLTNGTNFAVYYKIGTGSETQVCSSCSKGANTKTITLTTSGTMTLRFNKTGTSANNRLDDIVLTTEDDVSGGSDPTLTTSSSMTTLTYSAGSPAAQSFTIGGSNLTNTVTVTAPDDYEVCKTANGTYASSVSFTNTEVNAADKTVYIRLQSGLSAGNIASRNITVASSGADDKTIAVTGSVPYTITWSANGSTFATTYVAVGSTLALPASDPDPGTYSCTGKNFYGWYGAGSSYSSESVAPSIAANGDAVSADKTYYAVFADRSGSGDITWDKVTSAPSDWSGDYVITNAGGSNAMISDFYSGTSGEFLSSSVTISGSQITSTPTDKMIWTIAKNGSNAQYSLKNKSTGTYAKITGTSSTNAALDASAVWFTISCSSGTCIINSETNSARAFAWYSSRSSFRTYANTGNTYCNMYKKSGDGYTWSNYATTCQACVAPNHVDISGRWDRFGGETISLTATAYSSAGTGSPITSGITGYQWQKLVSTTWTDVTGANVSGATSNNLVITNCTADNSGKYRCVISTGATCSTASATATDGSEGHGVKVYVLECYTGGTTVYNFTRIGDTQAGTVQVPMNTANTGYTFKVHADNDYYGNNGTINEDVTNWVMCNNSTAECTKDLTVNSGLGGTFTFTMDYSTGGNSSVLGEPEISVTYPRKTIYFTPGVWNSGDAKFAFYYFRDGGSNGWTGFITANDCGSSADIPQWNGIKVIAVRLNSDATVGTWDKKWNQTSNITVTSNNSISITGWGPQDGDSPYDYGTYSVPTYTISYAKGSTTYTGGNEISGSKSSETKDCGVSFTLPNSAIFTTTGYTQTGWATSDGGSKAYDLGGSYTTNATQAFYPFWTVKTTTVSFNQNGGTGGQTSSKTATYGQAMPTPITCPTKEGYDFDGYYDGSGGTGTKYYNADGTSAKNWDKEDASYTLHAKWTIKSYTINWYVGGSAEGNKLTTGSQTTNVNHGGKVTTLPSTPDGSACDKVFVGWTNTSSYVHGTSMLFTDAAGSPTINADARFYAVFAAESGSGSATYDKVINAEDITSDGRYLIVYEGDETHDACAFDGSRDNDTHGNIDATSNTIAVSISESSITATAALANSEVILDVTNKTIKTKSGFSLGHKIQ